MRLAHWLAGLARKYPKPAQMIEVWDSLPPTELCGP